MTITQLETFLQIVEAKNFTSAADKLGYAQSTVTTQIKQLEEELGTELFDRLGRTVSLTGAGERLLLYARKMLELEREIRLSVPEGEEPSGILRLGISESLCYNRLPDLLTHYRRSFPSVTVELVFILHDTFPAMLKNGSLDLVYTLNPLIASDELKLLYKKKETLGFYTCPEHPLAMKKTVREKDLDGVPLLLTSHDCTFRAMLLSALEKEGIRPKISLETTNKTILRQFAGDGLGVAFIPDMVVQAGSEEGSLIRLPWKGAAFPVFSQIFVHKDKHINPAMQAFLDLAT